MAESAKTNDIFNWQSEDEEKKDLLVLLKVLEASGKKIIKPVSSKSKIKDIRDEFKMQMTILRYENNA
jgi:hypothetical protein